MKTANTPKPVGYACIGLTLGVEGLGREEDSTHADYVPRHVPNTSNSLGGKHGSLNFRGVFTPGNGRDRTKSVILIPAVGRTHRQIKQTGQSERTELTEQTDRQTNQTDTETDRPNRQTNQNGQS